MRYALISIMTLLLLLTGCDQSLTIEAQSDVPAPLVAELPLKMGILYEEQFRDYIYEENSEDRPNWTISTGTSQVELFDQILTSMFSSVSHLNEIAEAKNASLDGVLVPQIDEMQFAMPHETRTEFYEVWIKYKIRLHEPSGEVVGEWPLTGYGKSSTEFMKSRDKGMGAAINSAFRDAGAKLALNFANLPEVKTWLAGKPQICNASKGNSC